jgi:hypothetical protein
MTKGGVDKPETGEPEADPKDATSAAGSSEDAADQRSPADPGSKRPRSKEIGGPKGPEPTRYGDWEKGGRCSDF